MPDFSKPPSAMAPDDPPPHPSSGSGLRVDTSSGSDPRREALIASLRQRFALAQSRGDAEAKQALFREAAYLNLAPDLWQVPPT
jgi:hypothetical protein